MSYDLTFWREDGDVSATALEVQRALIDGRTVAGVATLPVDEMLERLDAVFDGWTRVDERLWSRNEDGSGPAFQVFTTEQVFHVSCYGMSGEDMNRLVDLGLAFGCPLYDPQTDERFA